MLPQIKDSSLILAASFLSAAIEIVGFIRDRSDKEDRPRVLIDQSTGPHTNVDGDQKNLLSGSFSGPTSAEGNAVDMRGSRGSINVVEGPLTQHFYDNIPPVSAPVPRIQPPPKKFVGRVGDINEILSGFEGGAVIAGVRGMGGVGKTALALVLAEKLAGSYPDGQILVDMKGTDKKPLSAAEAMAHVVRAYDPEFKMPLNEGEMAGKYFSILHGKRALLLLDNAANREQVEPLLPPKGCSLLVTSRNKFALPGLTEKDLDVLPLDDSKNLLLDICERIGEHAEELAKFCGCLPPALRNAASALKGTPNLTPTGYIKRLSDLKTRLKLMDVEASFDLSYQLLTPELQRLWSLLSVFPADFDLAGAAAVWEMEEMPSEDALGELIRWSLVDFSPSATGEGGRYRLHDLARDFAGSRLDAADSEPARLRHAEHYRDVLSRANEIYKQGKDGVLKGLQLFDQERANILAGQSWAEKNLDGNSSAAIDLCKSYPDIGAQVLDLRLSPREMIHWFEAALEASRRLDDKRAEGNSLGNLGLAYSDLGDPRKAIDFHDQALVISREMGDRRGEGADLGNLGSAYYRLGDPRKAIEYYEEALAISRETGDRRNEGVHLFNMSLSLRALGQNERAASLATSALEIFEQIESPDAEDVRKTLAGWGD